MLGIITLNFVVKFSKVPYWIPEIITGVTSTLG